MTYFSTALSLGVTNVARVLIYRFFKRTGIYRWLLPPRNSVPLGLDLSRAAPPPPVSEADLSVLTEAEGLLAGKADYFSIHTQAVGNPPDWFLNPFLNKRHPQPSVHWSVVPDFAADTGDIKVIWEMSRFMWAPVFARAWRVSGDRRYLAALQSWMEDWWRSNPPNVGPNWKCGQETSIRLINTLLAFRLVGSASMDVQALIPFVDAHCRRVALTMFYAIGQDNNHGTSEATGLLVGGAWLARNASGAAMRRGKRWAKQGRKLLLRLVNRLVLPDGSFSQHSLTYHRVMLDTLSMAEAFRRESDEPPFQPAFYARAAAAVRWLGAMIEPSSGDGPNLGANDGALPYRLGAEKYRDFRPSLQLASVIFLGTKALETGPWDEPLLWLGLQPASQEKPWLREQGGTLFERGGYGVLRSARAAESRLIVRAPTAKFRPSQADALHVDLWWKGQNILRDGGTYSYAEGHEISEVLAGVPGHNTVQFDGRDQMPRLGRFLYGAWVRVERSAITVSGDGPSWSGSYTDGWGAHHERTVNLLTNGATVRDRVRGFQQSAVLRWRLAPGDWVLNGTHCTSVMGQLRIESSVPIRRISLQNGWESRHYLEKSAVPVLEVEISQAPAEITTTVTLS